MLLLLDLLLHLVELINLFRHLRCCIAMLLLQSNQDSIMLYVGLLQISSQLIDLSLSLLVEINLGISGTTSLLHSLTEIIKFSGQTTSLLLCLSPSLSLSFKFFFLLRSTWALVAPPASSTLSLRSSSSLARPPLCFSALVLACLSASSSSS